MGTKQSTDHAQTGPGVSKGRVVPKDNRVVFPPSNGPSGAGISGKDASNRNKRT